MKGQCRNCKGTGNVRNYISYDIGWKDGKCFVCGGSGEVQE